MHAIPATFSAFPVLISSTHAFACGLRRIFTISQHLEGTNALAISTADATAPARILAKYAKQFPALELIAGVVEGAYNDQAGIQALSQVPSREELLGKLLGSIQSPITNFARVLNQIAEANGGAAETEAAAE